MQKAVQIVTHEVFQRKSKRDEFFDILLCLNKGLSEISGKLLELDPLQQVLLSEKRWADCEMINKTGYDIADQCCKLHKQLEQLNDMGDLIREPLEVDAFIGEPPQEQPQEQPGKDKCFWETTEKLEKIARIEGLLIGGLIGMQIGIYALRILG